MSRRVRIFIGLLILLVSLSLLVWGLLPARRETRVQPILPAELQLPTPESFLFEKVSPPGSPQFQPVKVA